MLLLTLPTYSYLEQTSSQWLQGPEGEKSAQVLPSGARAAPSVEPSQAVSADQHPEAEKRLALRTGEESQAQARGGGFRPEGPTRSSLADQRPSFSRPNRPSVSDSPLPGRSSTNDRLFSIPASRADVRSVEDQDLLLDIEDQFDRLGRPTFGAIQNPFRDSGESPTGPTGEEDGTDDGPNSGGGGENATPVDDQPAKENPPAEDPPQSPQPEDPAGSEGDGGDGSGDSDPGDQDGGDEGNSPEDPPPPPEDPPPPEEPSAPEEPGPPRQEPVPYDFIISRGPAAPGQPYTMRAKRGQDGFYLLENEEVFAFSPLQVQSSLSVGSDAQVLMTDFNGDGLSDAVLGFNVGQGALVELYLRRSADGADFGRAEGSILLTGETISSLALFDFNGDQSLDVVTVLEGRPSLLILELQEGRLQATGELILTFRPGLVIDWRAEHTGRPERRLYIYDEEFERAAVMTSLQLDFVREVPVDSGLVPTPRVTRVNWRPQQSGSPNRDILIFESHFRSIIVEAEAQGVFRLYANLDLTFDRPLSVIGDYSFRGSRSITILP